MIARRVKDIDYVLLPGADRKTTDIVIERNNERIKTKLVLVEMK